MSDYLVIRGERFFNRIADACTFEMEGAFADGLGADVYTLGLDEPPTGKRYKAAFYFANSFKVMSEAVEEIGKQAVNADMSVGYIFAGYLHKAKPMMNPAARLLWKRYKLLRKLDTIFLGTEKFVDPISEGLRIPMHYLPMAADVRNVGAGPGSRMISITGFGRQDKAISDLLSDRFNRPDSERFYYNTNYINSKGLVDWRRYRAMFWHVLRNSELSLAFDQLHTNPTGEFEAQLRRAALVRRPRGRKCRCRKGTQIARQSRLLDWEDATIELPDAAEPAVQAICDLLGDRPRVEAAIHRNLVQMNRRHDWRHRARDMLVTLGLEVPGTLSDQIGEMSRHADSL